VLISQDELDSIEETLDVLGDPELLASLRKSRHEAAVGRVTDLADLTDLGGNPLPVPPPTGG
jgi:PHD/YefM family antitoxin component YafN of YafNO toxin-antitoxin module